MGPKQVQMRFSKTAPKLSRIPKLAFLIHTNLIFTFSPYQCQNLFNVHALRRVWSAYCTVCGAHKVRSAKLHSVWCPVSHVKNLQ